jgi:hypothetical protein
MRQTPSSRGGSGISVPVRTASTNLTTAGKGQINTQSTVGRQTVDFLAKALAEEQEQRLRKERILEQLLAEESVSELLFTSNHPFISDFINLTFLISVCRRLD